MTLTDYQQLIQRWALKEQDAAIKKLADYAGGDDALGLLKATAVETGQPVLKTWESWMVRHTIPIKQILATITTESPELTDHMRQIIAWRAADCLGYLFLLLALIEEARPPLTPSMSRESLPDFTIRDHATPDPTQPHPTSPDPTVPHPTTPNLHDLE